MSIAKVFNEGSSVFDVQYLITDAAIVAGKENIAFRVQPWLACSCLPCNSQHSRDKRQLVFIMIPQSESLLKFENPVLISTGKDKKGASKTIRKVRVSGQTHNHC